MIEREPFVQATPGAGHVNKQLCGFSIVDSLQTAVSKFLCRIRIDATHEVNDVSRHGYLEALFRFLGFAFLTRGSGGVFKRVRSTSSGLGVFALFMGKKDRP